MADVTPPSEEKHYKLEDAKRQSIDVETVPVYDDAGPVGLMPDSAAQPTIIDIGIRSSSPRRRSFVAVSTSAIFR